MLSSKPNTKEEDSLTPDFSTNLAHALASENASTVLNEFFRSQLEKAINDLLQSEMSAFLDYEKYSSSGRGSGNSRNGSYSRMFATTYGKLRITCIMNLRRRCQLYYICSTQCANSVFNKVIFVKSSNITGKEFTHNY